MTHSANANVTRIDFSQNKLTVCAECRNYRSAIGYYWTIKTPVDLCATKTHDEKESINNITGEHIKRFVDSKGQPQDFKHPYCKDINYGHCEMFAPKRSFRQRLAAAFDQLIH